MPKQTNKQLKNNKKTIHTGGKRKKDRALIVRVGPPHHPRPRPPPRRRPPPRTAVVCNIL